MKEYYTERKSCFRAMKFFFTLALLFVFAATGYAQHVVRGTVTDESGSPVPGANVLVKGTVSGTTTDASGRYSIQVAPAKEALIFSYLGMVSQEVNVSGRSMVNVVLKEDAARLDEVVVVGYGTQKKAHLTGSVAAVSASEILKTTSSTVSQALVGKLPGIMTQQSLGQPGSDDVTILVRGYSSYNGSTPLVLVDGVKRPMSSVDPHDVEAITVLKDASACAVYGLEAANGVILVTTKRGMEGSAVINYSGSVTLSHATALPKMMNGTQYMQYYNLGLQLDGEKPLFTEEQIASTYNGDPTDGIENTDWTKPLYRTTLMHQHNLSISGGSQKINYFVSGGFLSQDGIMKDHSYQRGTFRSNVEAKPHKNIDVSLNVAGSVADNYVPGGYPYENQKSYNLVHLLLYSLPFIPAEYDGMPTSAYRNANNAANPIYGSANSGFQQSRRTKIETSARVEYSFPFLQGLKAAMFASWDWADLGSKTFIYAYDLMAAEFNRSTGELSYRQAKSANFVDGGNMYVGNQKVQQVILRPQITYAHKFGKHDVGALFLYEQTTDKSSKLAAGRQNFALYDLPELNFGTSTTASNEGASGKAVNAGFVGRVNYAFDDKYLAEFSFRYDGSYLFHKDNRWGFFPSMSLGWVMSKEEFFKRALPKVEFFKLRASIGVLGAKNCEAFLYRKSYSWNANAVVFGNTAQNVLYNAVAYPFEDLTWERIRSTNVGFDLSVWNGKLGVEFDYFYKYTYNILNNVSSVYPESLGGRVPTRMNTGSFDNRGFELVLKHRNRVGDFRYGVTGQLTYAHNRILTQQQSDNTLPWQNRIGSSVGAVWGFKSLGLYQTQEEIDNAPKPIGVQPRLGDIRYADINGDGQITSDDMVEIARAPMPEMMFSLALDGAWKGFDLSVQFQGAALVDKMLMGAWYNTTNVVDLTPLTVPWYGNYDNAPLYLVENSWRPDNTDAEYPRLSVNKASYSNNARLSDFWKRNGAYLRLKNVTLGYTLPRSVTSKIGLSKVRVYASGTNLFTATEFDYIDPESANVVTGYYPQQRTISFGLDVSF